MKKAPFLLIPAFLFAMFVGCAPSDEQITESVQNALSSNPALSPVSATVDKGIVTLTGEVETAELKTQAENGLTGIKGVKSVVNTVTVKPQGPSPEELQQAADNELLTKVHESFSRYKVVGITATVNEGIVTLTGDVKRSNLQNVMKAAMESGAVKVENQMTIK